MNIGIKVSQKYELYINIVNKYKNIIKYIQQLQYFNKLYVSKYGISD